MTWISSKNEFKIGSNHDETNRKNHTVFILSQVAWDMSVHIHHDRGKVDHLFNLSSKI